jgi:hypothetical protein
MSSSPAAVSNWKPVEPLVLEEVRVLEEAEDGWKICASPCARAVAPYLWVRVLYAIIRGAG